MDKLTLNKSQMRKLKTKLTKLQNLTLQKRTCFEKGYDCTKVNAEHKKALNNILNMFVVEE